MYDAAGITNTETLQAEQFRFLGELVLQPSYSKSKHDVDKVGKLILKEIQRLGLPMEPEVIEQKDAGNHLVFRSPACKGGRAPVLLAGHMDTVFPPESDFKFFKEDNGKVFGPGVIDMKGGLATAIYALKLLHDRNMLEKIPVILLCNSDEEIGSPTSTELIRTESRRGLFGLVFECGGLGGEIVTGRKGKYGFTLQVSGQAGHAAFAGRNKASAVLELAHKVIAIEQLNDPSRQLVVNVGTVSGGVGPNTIAERASARVDTRFLLLSDGDSCEKSMNRIASRNSVPGTSGLLIRTSGRAPMEQTDANRRLFRLVREQATSLGITVQEELRSGVSDANTISASGLPVVDGMGPVGDCDHSDREYMIRDSLMEKTLLAAQVIEKGWANGGLT